MKQLRILTFACLILAAVLSTGYAFYQQQARDDTLPEIRCPEEPLVLSVNNTGDEALLEGVTAWDAKDGDLTAQLLLQGITKRAGDSTATVTYAVVDSDNHVVTCTRQLEYKDYRLPRFQLDKELRYSVGSALRVKDRLSASDSIDGDLTDRIRIVSSSTSTTLEGTYPVTFQVTNSLNDTASITLDIVVKNYASGEPRILLSDYLIYQNAGAPFNARKYIKSVVGGDAGSVVIHQPDTFAPGMNKVTYTCTGSGGTESTVTLYVVVE